MTLSTGMRFGQMQVKTGLYHVLSHFEVATWKETHVPIVFETKSFLLASKAEIPLFFERRQQ